MTEIQISIEPRKGDEVTDAIIKRMNERIEGRMNDRIPGVVIDLDDEFEAAIADLPKDPFRFAIRTSKDEPDTCDLIFFGGGPTITISLCKHDALMLADAISGAFNRE